MRKLENEFRGTRIKIHNYWQVHSRSPRVCALRLCPSRIGSDTVSPAHAQDVEPYNAVRARAELSRHGVWVAYVQIPQF